MSYWKQAKFWAREYRRRAPHLAAGMLTPGANASVVRALEAVARPRDLTLGTSFPRATDITLETHRMADGELLHLPGSEGFLPEDGFWFPPVRVHRLTGVTLDAMSGLLFARTWVVNGSGTGQRWAMDSAFITGAAVRVRRGSTRREVRTLAPLGNHVEHYHFLMETLPQVLRVRQLYPEAIFITTVPPQGTPSAILEDLGVRVEVVAADAVLECESVVFCESLPRERTHPADMRLLFDTFTSDLVRSDRGEKIYISRARSLRALRDEQALEEFLAGHGFRTCYLEEMRFPEQVAALHAATWVIAPHGGGLANVVFMPSGGRVIELATGEWWSNAFRRIATARGHDYRLVTLTSGPDARWGTATEAIAKLSDALSQGSET